MKRIPIEQRLLEEFREQEESCRAVVDDSSTKKKRKASKLSSLVPPQKCRRKLPDVSVKTTEAPVNKTSLDHQNVLRYILTNMDQGKALTDFLPLTRGQDIASMAIQPEKFQDIDPETEEKLNSMYNAEIEKKAQERLLEQELNETTEYRSESPGKKYEKEFINAEIGVRKPRFKASVLKEMFKDDPSLSKADFKRLLASGKHVEKELNQHYDRHANPELIEKRMMSDYKKKKLHVSLHSFEDE